MSINSNYIEVFRYCSGTLNSLYSYCWYGNIFQSTVAICNEKIPKKIVFIVGLLTPWKILTILFVTCHLTLPPHPPFPKESCEIAKHFESLGFFEGLNFGVLNEIGILQLLFLLDLKQFFNYLNNKF